MRWHIWRRSSAMSAIGYTLVLRSSALSTLVVLVMAGCGGSATTTSAVAEATESPTPEPTPEPTPTERPTPSPTPEPETQSAAVGETVAITCGGTDCLRLTVTEPSFAGIYPDPDGFLADEPQVAGNVFMQVFVEYEAVSSAANYNPFDWAVFADGRAVDSYVFTIHGPQPILGSGQLPAGRTASGWLVYEVPAAGEVVLAYAPNFEGPPVFEVVLR